MKVDKQLISVTHFSQLLSYITGFGGLIVPLIIWSLKKDEIHELDDHGKLIINFQLSLIIYALISIPFCFIIIGFIPLILVGLIGFIFPIINGIKASNGELTHYPFSINILK